MSAANTSDSQATSLLSDKTLRGYFAHLKSIMKLSNVSQCLLDRDGKIIQVNPLFLRVFGYEETDLIGEQLSKYIVADDQKSWSEISAFSQGLTDLDRNAELRVLNTAPKAIYCNTEVRLLNEPLTNRQFALVSLEDRYSLDRSDEKIRESEVLYRTIFNSTTDGMVLVNLKGGYPLDCNEQMVKMLKCSRRDLLEGSAVSYSPEFQPDGANSMEKFIEINKRCQIEGKTFNFEWRHRRNDGEEFDAEVIMTPFEIKDQQLWICITRDISERKKREAAIIQNEKLFRSVFEGNSQGMALIGKDLCFTNVNPALCQMTELEESKLVGMSMTSLIHPDMRLPYAAKMKEVVNGDISFFNMELVVHKQDQKELITNLNISGIFDSKNQFSYAVAAIEDITEKIISRQALEQSEHLYKTICNSFPNGFVLVFNQNLEFTNVGGPLLERLDYKVDQLLGRSAYELLPDGNNWNNLIPYFREAFEGNATQLVLERSPFVYSIHILPLHNEQGEVYAGMTIVQDIGNLRRIETELANKVEELNTKNQELERYIESNFDLEKFAHVASHDLKAPLRSMGSFASILVNRYADKLDERGQNLLGYIHRSSSNLSQMIDDVLAYSKVESEETLIEEENTQELLSGVIAQLEGRIKEHQVEIEIKDLPDTIKVSKVKFTRLMQNLIDNSIKYSRKEVASKITISSTKLVDHWQFEVKDNGIGIPADKLESVFTYFERSKQAQDYDGSGLGLAICKKMVEQHQGEIWLKSELGKSTTCYFTLPQ